jgi:hypothetical protein
MCMFCRSLFVFLYFSFCPLCFLLLYDWRILITSLWYLQTRLRQGMRVCLKEEWQLTFYIKLCHMYILSRTWSISHGIRQGTSSFPLNICGKAELKLGAAWIAGKLIFPMLSLSENPKISLNTICVGHHYAQTNTNNVNKTWAPSLQTTGGKDEPIIFNMRK